MHKGDTHCGLGEIYNFFFFFLKSTPHLLDKADDLVNFTWLAQEVVDLDGSLLAERAGPVGLEAWSHSVVTAKRLAEGSAGELGFGLLEGVGDQHRGVGSAGSANALWKLWADVVHNEISLGEEEKRKGKQTRKKGEKKEC